MSKKEEPKLPFDQQYVKTYLESKAVKEHHLNDVEFRGDYKISTGSKIFDQMIDGGFGSGLIRFVGPTETGKCLKNSELVLTPNGWISIGEIKLGDKVIDSQGRPQNVIGVYPQGEKDVYEVTFKSGAKVVCCGEHLWEVSSAQERAEGRKSVRDLNYIKDTLMCGVRRNYSVRLVKPVQFEYKTFTVDPYLLGVLLGDGGITDSIKITNVDEEVWDEVKAALNKHEKGWSLTSDGDTKSIVFKGETFNPLINKLRHLGLFGKLSHEKFVPEEYKFGSIKQRLSLVQGLMDTDGFVAKNGEMVYYSVSEKLLDDFIYLIRSLGGTISKRDKDTYYRDKEGKRVPCKQCFICNFKLPENLAPCRLSRKLKRVRKENRNLCDFIDSVEPAGKEECTCIRVDSQDHLFVTNDFILTHNTAEALQVQEEFLKKVEGSKGILVKAEGRLDKEMRDRVNTKFVWTPEEWVEGTCWVFECNVYEIVFDLLRALVVNKDNPTRYHIIIDSMDGLIHKGDLGKKTEDAPKVAAGALMTSDFLKRTNLFLGKRGHQCIMMSQVRAEIKGQYEQSDKNRLGGGSGGNAAAHYPNWVIEFLRPTTNDYFRPDKEKPIDSDNRPWGRYCGLKICKSTNETTMMRLKYPIKFGRKGRSAIWSEMEVVDLLAMWGYFDKSGSWFATGKELTEYLGGKKNLQGMKQWYEEMEKDPDLFQKLSDFVDENILSLV